MKYIYYVVRFTFTISIRSGFKRLQTVLEPNTTRAPNCYKRYYPIFFKDNSREIKLPSNIYIQLIHCYQILSSVDYSFWVLSKVFKLHRLERGFHTIIKKKCFVSLSNRRRISQWAEPSVFVGTRSSLQLMRDFRL